MAKKKRKKPRKVRVSLELNEQVVNRMQAIAEATGATTRTQVIRQAFAVYEAIVQALQEDSVVVFRSPSGQERELLVFLD